MSEAVRDTGAVLRRSLTFFLRHGPIILGLGLLVSLQRFLAVGGDERFGFAGGPAGELFTLAVRLVFLIWLVRAVLWLPGRSLAEGLTRVAGSARSRPQFLLCCGGVLLIMVAVFKLGVDGLITWGVPSDLRPTALAWELAIKNLTVIPFLMVWTAHTLAELMRPVTGATVSASPDR